jgi:predicted dienelactone hydrolase
MFVGSREVQIRDEVQGVWFPAIVMYPTEVAPTPTRFGPYFIEASANAPITAGCYPLVVFSHGSGGSHLLYRTICMHLAGNGYVVVMLEHPGNNRNHNELEGTNENLMNRPRHIRLAIDAVLSNVSFKDHVLADKVAVVGHSMGGYTALAIAGGTPWSQDGRKVDVVADPRVRALVLLAPATPWYLPEGALSQVQVPILMLIAEHDPYTPRWQADLVLNGVPNSHQVTFRVVENAGHFSFLSPFPSTMKAPGFLPATDPEGFDREQFHRELPREVRQFLDSQLKLAAALEELS